LLKIKHKLIDVIVITLYAVLAGADEWTEIADFGRIRQEFKEIGVKTAET